jgi:hypothetical protein
MDDIKIDELRKLITVDIEERELIKIGIKRVRSRQLFLSAIGILIVIMFAVNFFQVREQQKKEDTIIQMMNDVANVANALIKAQDETIDSLIIDSPVHK